MNSKANRLLFPGLIFAALTCPSNTGAQRPPTGEPNQQQLSKLAEKVCSQLPNVALLPFKDRFSGDDVHDTLIMLGEYAVPCLVDRISDETWMPDPRQAPTAPEVRAGDIAFFILNELGVDFDIVLPMLDKEKWDGVGIYAYFAWANRPGNRKRLQEAVREWLRNHPDCCRSSLPLRSDSPLQPRFQLNLPELSQFQKKLAQLQPGMDAASIMQTLGRPDSTLGDEPLKSVGLGMVARAEGSAAMYFVERWSAANNERDFLRDRYVILFFTARGELVRMFSNVEGVPPLFPANRKEWFRVAWPHLEP
jgi:hypothetical protein